MFIIRFPKETCDLCQKPFPDSLRILRKPVIICSACAKRIEETGDWREKKEVIVDAKDLELI